MPEYSSRGELGCQSRGWVGSIPKRALQRITGSMKATRYLGRVLENRARTSKQAKAGRMEETMLGLGESKFSGLICTSKEKQCKSANWEEATWKFRLSGSAAWDLVSATGPPWTRRKGSR